MIRSWLRTLLRRPRPTTAPDPLAVRELQRRQDVALRDLYRIEAELWRRRRKAC